MRRWFMSGLPVGVAVALLALAWLLALSYGTYRYVFRRMNDALDERVLRAAREGARAAAETAGLSLAGLWTEEEGRLLGERLLAIRRASGLENLFVFDSEVRALADARPMIPPGKQYTLVHLSPGAIQRVWDGQETVDRKIEVESISFRNATVPLVVDGEVVGGVYAQADIDFEEQLGQLRRHWQAAAALSFAVSAVLVFAAISVTLYTGRMREALNKRARLGLVHLLSAGISHDIKNPLGGIMASRELLEEHVEGNVEAQELLGYIREGADQILEITQGLLGKSTEEKENIVLSDAVGSLVKQLHPVSTAKNVQIVAHIDPEALVLGSRAAFRMALANVLKNALEAVEPGKGRIHIACRGDARRVGTAVSDNGPGIPSGLRKRIFDPLVTTKDEGTGLGLPVTRQILEDMHGSFELETEPGRGSTFILWLPRAETVHG